MAKKPQTSPIAQAEAHIAAGRTEHAVPLLRKAIAAMAGHPQLARVHDRLGTVLITLGRLDEAVIELERSVRLDPGLTNRYHLAQALAFSGRHGDVLPLLESNLREDPGHAPSLARLAAVLQYTGEHERALAILDDSFSKGLGGSDLVHSYAMLAIAQGRVADAVDRVRPLTVDPSISPHVRGDLYFRLGKLLENLGDDPGAWDAYVEGNRLVASPFDPDAHDAEVDRIIATFTPETIAKLASEQSDETTMSACERAVLVVGMPRSGTTLIEQMIAAHPDAASGGELKDLPIAVRLIPGMKHHEQFPPLSRVRGNALKKARAAYLAALDRVSPDTARVTDKLPYNFLRLGLVPAVLPGASIVHSARHPCDTALSCFFRNFQRGNEWSTSLDNIARYTLAYRRLMDHWRSVLPEAIPGIRFVEAEYERVVTDPDGESRKVISVLGLPWHDACAAPSKEKKMIPTLEPDQAGRGVYATSRDRWRRYESQLAPFIGAIGGVHGSAG